MDGWLSAAGKSPRELMDVYGWHCQQLGQQDLPVVDLSGTSLHAPQPASCPLDLPLQTVCRGQFLQVPESSLPGGDLEEED